MSNILGSASKLAFLILTITACVGFLVRILDSKDFMLLAGMAFGFYFAHKGEPNQPYNGK